MHRAGQFVSASSLPLLSPPVPFGPFSLPSNFPSSAIIMRPRPYRHLMLRMPTEHSRAGWSTLPTAAPLLRAQRRATRMLVHTETDMHTQLCSHDRTRKHTRGTSTAQYFGDREHFAVHSFQSARLLCKPARGRECTNQPLSPRVLVSVASVRDVCADKRRLRRPWAGGDITAHIHLQGVCACSAGTFRNFSLSCP